MLGAISHLKRRKSGGSLGGRGLAESRQQTFARRSSYESEEFFLRKNFPSSLSPPSLLSKWLLLLH
jgi:hypothetical protein